MPITLAGFHHAGFLVTDVERAAAFYENVLAGLKPLPRPDLGFPGMWYDLLNGHQLHLMSVTGMPGHADPPRHDRHIALSVHECCRNAIARTGHSHRLWQRARGQQTIVHPRPGRKHN